MKHSTTKKTDEAFEDSLFFNSQGPSLLTSLTSSIWFGQILLKLRSSFPWESNPWPQLSGWKTRIISRCRGSWVFQDLSRPFTGGQAGEGTSILWAIEKWFLEPLTRTFCGRIFHKPNQPILTNRSNKHSVRQLRDATPPPSTFFSILTTESSKSILISSVWTQVWERKYFFPSMVCFAFSNWLCHLFCRRFRRHTYSYNPGYNAKVFRETRIGHGAVYGLQAKKLHNVWRCAGIAISIHAWAGMVHFVQINAKKCIRDGYWRLFFLLSIVFHRDDTCLRGRGSVSSRLLYCFWNHQYDELHGIIYRTILRVYLYAVPFSKWEMFYLFCFFEGLCCSYSLLWARSCIIFYFWIGILWLE